MSLKGKQNIYLYIDINYILSIIFVQFKWISDIAYSLHFYWQLKFDK